MPLFSVFHARDGGPEWRESDWRITDPLHQGRECPRCKASVCSGKSWRDHWAWHRDQDAALEAMDGAVRVLGRAVRLLALEAGHDDWYPDPDGGEEDQAEPVMTGRVIGNGPLPEEMRGGEA